MNNTICYINGKWVQTDNATIPFNDAGFLYGDGLFETMRFDNRKIFSPKKHLNRLFEGLYKININISYSSNDILEILHLIITKNNLDSGIIRLIITRGNLNSLLDDVKANMYINIKPFYDIPTPPVKVVYFDESKFPIIRFNPAIKSMNYLGNMLAKKAAHNEGYFEPVFFNKDKIITECAIRNIFFIKNNILFTPTIELGILSGVMRETIIEIANHLNLEVQETLIYYHQIHTMDEAFISSTGIGLLECFWDDWKSNYLITKQIKKELFKRIKNS